MASQDNESNPPPRQSNAFRIVTLPPPSQIAATRVGATAPRSRGVSRRQSQRFDPIARRATSVRSVGFAGTGSTGPQRQISNAPLHSGSVLPPPGHQKQQQNQDQHRQQSSVPLSLPSTSPHHAQQGQIEPSQALGSASVGVPTSGLPQPTVAQQTEATAFDASTGYLQQERGWFHETFRLVGHPERQKKNPKIYDHIDPMTGEPCALLVYKNDWTQFARISTTYEDGSRDLQVPPGVVRGFDEEQLHELTDEFPYVAGCILRLPVPKPGENGEDIWNLRNVVQDHPDESSPMFRYLIIDEAWFENLQTYTFRPMAPATAVKDDLGKFPYLASWSPKARKYNGSMLKESFMTFTAPWYEHDPFTADLATTRLECDGCKALVRRALDFQRDVPAASMARKEAPPFRFCAHSLDRLKDTPVFEKMTTDTDLLPAQPAVTSDPDTTTTTEAASGAVFATGTASATDIAAGTTSDAPNATEPGVALADGPANGFVGSPPELYPIPTEAELAAARHHLASPPTPLATPSDLIPEHLLRTLPQREIANVLRLHQFLRLPLPTTPEEKQELVNRCLRRGRVNDGFEAPFIPQTMKPTEAQPGMGHTQATANIPAVPAEVMAPYSGLGWGLSYPSPAHYVLESPAPMLGFQPAGAQLGAWWNGAPVQMPIAQNPMFTPSNAGTAGHWQAQQNGFNAAAPEFVPGQNLDGNGVDGIDGNAIDSVDNERPVEEGAEGTTQEDKKEGIQTKDGADTCIVTDDASVHP
ncbi:hypothetical protein BJ508DRAFT_323033 [Ascobolus immersus RN42]|uniref:Uncharacterized protein n=1 Tax=Ascobolus immersus RN42 TaxID=1160509 RepID=A0A3N4IM46_ASCIM|nr:hypothetical protein BJ508DRAFT_323033 [Ascobolus immersus RN42]